MQNQIDSIDIPDVLIDDQVLNLPPPMTKLKQAYYAWLITPQERLGGHTPLEARRYAALRARLSQSGVERTGSA